MGILDIVIIAILAIAFISGMQKGLITSALACVAMAGAFFIAKGFEGKLAASFEGTEFSQWLNSNFEGEADWNGWFHALSFIIVFILSYAALMLVVNLINNMVRMPKLKGADALLGGVLGLVRGYVVVCLAVAAIKVLAKPLETEGQFVDKLLDGSTLGRFFNGTSSLADLFGVGKTVLELK